MALILSVSTATVRSDSDLLPQLFTWHTQSIELTRLRSIHDYTYIYEKSQATGVKLALHSPLFCIDDANGLLWDQDTPWRELERNLYLARKDHLQYVLVNFPYPWDRSSDNLGCDIKSTIKKTARKIKGLSSYYGIPVFLRPMVGPKEDPKVFSFLMSEGTPFIESLGLGICIDLGSVFLAAKKRRTGFLEMIRILAPCCTILHLHHIWYGGKKSIRTPVSKGGNIPIMEALKLVERRKKDVYAVLTYTPQRVASRRQVEEGLNWLLNSTGPWKGRDTYPTYDGRYKRIR